MTVRRIDSRRWWAACFVAASIALAGAACSPTDNHTLLVVNVQNHLAAAEIDEIVVAVATTTGMLTSESFAPDKPVQLGVRPKGAPDFDVTVTASGRLKGVAVVTQIASPVRFTPGVANQLTLVLDHACATPGLCSDSAQTCKAGQCVPRSQLAVLSPYPGTGTPDGGGSGGAGGSGGSPDAGARDAPPITGTWTTSPSPGIPGQATLSSVWPIATNDVWVVGGQGAGGLAFHFDGAEWTSIPLPMALPLYGVWASGPDDVWMVGFLGTLLHRTAAGVATVASGSQATLTGIWGASANDIWAVGGSGTVLHWDGMAWSPAAAGVVATVNLLGITGSRADDLWAVGSGGNVYRGSAGMWQRQNHGGLTATALFGVWAAAGAAPDVWAVGAGAALHLSGTTWTLTRDTPDVANSVWGSAGDDVWSVGSLMTKNGPVTHFDGSAWSVVASPAKPPTTLQSIHGLSAGDIWAVGTNALIMHFHAP